MSDIFSKEKRSQIMAKVKGSDTKPEILIRKFLFSQGFRYRKNVKTLPGTPDIVLRKYQTAIFINGCFWHGHKNCKAATLPKSRQEYWFSKIERNTKRDLKKKRELKKLGWKTITIWECDVKKILKENSRKQLYLLKVLRERNS